MIRRLLWGWVMLALPLALACSDRSGAGGTGGVGGSKCNPALFGAECPDLGVRGPCQQGPFCLTCPLEKDYCESNDDCAVGFQCTLSDCLSEDGGEIRTCVFSPSPPCGAQGECPKDRECMDLGEEYGMRCVKVTEGCNSRFDCPPGYTCEDSECTDRRLPCQLNDHCPKSHKCVLVGAQEQFCMRVHESCLEDQDCSPDLAPRCADVDGDGKKECAPVFDPNVYPPEACLNENCGGATPVCEFSSTGSSASCGRYGLCRPGMSDCAAGFECVALWLDGRSECVPTGGSCSHISDCPSHQVCASARDGGPPSCQAGLVE